MKKTLIITGSVTVTILLVVALVLNSWTDTGHGRLNLKAAILLRIMDMSGNQLPEKLDNESIRRYRETLNSGVKNTFADLTPVEKILNKSIPGPDSDTPIRIYRPTKEDNLPVVIFFHGGGWIVGNPDTHENITRYIAAKANSIVVSVDYRLAPEHPFPAGVMDAYASLLWVSKNASSFGGDPTRIAVMGDSAGGNLAAVVCIMARDRNGPRIAHQTLLYPATDISNFNSESHKNFKNGYFINRREMVVYRQLYAPDSHEWTNPLASPLLAESHKNLPPATIITAEIDPLRDDGRNYANKLKAAGVNVTYRNYRGMLHAFAGFDGMFDESHEALDEVAEDLNKSFAVPDIGAAKVE